MSGINEAGQGSVQDTSHCFRYTGTTLGKGEFRTFVYVCHTCLDKSMLVLGYVRFTLNCRCRSCGVNDENVNSRPLMHNLKETTTKTSVFHIPFSFFIVDTITNRVQKKLLHISWVL